MNQSRGMSAVESVVNVAVGFGIAVGSQYVIFPMFGIYVPLHEHVIIGLFFTVVSLARSYALRRLFNGIKGIT